MEGSGKNDLVITHVSVHDVKTCPPRKYELSHKFGADLCRRKSESVPTKHKIKSWLSQDSLKGSILCLFTDYKLCRKTGFRRRITNFF